MTDLAYQGEDHGIESDQNEATATNEKRIELWLNEGDRPGIPFAALEVSEFLGLGYETTRRSLYELWAKGLIKRYRPKKQKHFVYHTGECSEQKLTNVSSGEPSSTDQLRSQLRKPDDVRVTASSGEVGTQNVGSSKSGSPPATTFEM